MCFTVSEKIFIFCYSFICKYNIFLYLKSEVLPEVSTPEVSTPEVSTPEVLPEVSTPEPEVKLIAVVDTEMNKRKARIQPNKKPRP